LGDFNVLLVGAFASQTNSSRYNNLTRSEPDIQQQQRNHNNDI